MNSPTSKRLTYERNWNDRSNEKIKKGRFSPREEGVIIDSLCAFAVRKGLDRGDLMRIIAESLENKKGGVWPQIAAQLPHRSVQAVQNFCKRKFNPHNYKGLWTPEEENELRGLYEGWGPRWKKIAEMLERTPTNVRDKWRTLSETPKKAYERRPWTLDETFRLLEVIQNELSVKILITEISNILAEENDQIKTKNQAEVIHKYLNPEVDLKKLKIPWTRVANSFSQRSLVDCRNKWKLDVIGSFKFKCGSKVLRYIDLIIELKPCSFEEIVENAEISQKFKNPQKLLSKILHCLDKLPQESVIDYFERSRKIFRKKSSVLYEKNESGEEKNKLLIAFSIKKVGN